MSGRHVCRKQVYNPKHDKKTLKKNGHGKIIKWLGKNVNASLSIEMNGKGEGWNVGCCLPYFIL